MSEEPRATASPHYAVTQLDRALRTAVSGGNAGSRRRAEAKVKRWTAVLDGLADGTLEVGSRTPVTDTPAWVTLEVAHGGFATGRYLAEVPLGEDESDRLVELPDGIPGRTARERLNLWYLSDEGQAELVTALRTGTYYVDVPEEAALLVVAWLIDRGHHELALDLVADLRPLLHRLRMTPRFRSLPRPAGALVRLETTGEVRERLRSLTTRPPLAAMLETLRVWNPLYDRLVAQWCDTVDDALPRLDENANVAGGWPCRRWPADWTARRNAWLEDYRTAVRDHQRSSAHRNPKSNFAQLRQALEACPEDSGRLSAREVGRIRRALANTITKHGAPGTEPRAALRAIQAAAASRPTHAVLAQVLAMRLDSYADDGGIPAVEPLAVPVAEGEHADVEAGQPLPDHLVKRVTRALEAPVGELVDRGVITSGEVLAKVLPQLTSQTVASTIADADLAGVYAQVYAAFRRRRSFLLLNLEHQVRFEELPWIGAVEAFHGERGDASSDALRVLRQTTMLAVTSFPHAVLPNPLVREIGALAVRAGVTLPLVEELAADIFMGKFTVKWRQAAKITSDSLAGSLYARYYDLPSAEVWTEPSTIKTKLRWGKPTADDFAEMCTARAKESSGEWRGYGVAANGTVLEQSQILTTQNLAVLVFTLSLRSRVAEVAPDLADRAFEWTVRRLAIRPAHLHHALVSLKNAAYAWRQAIFFLSFAEPREQHASLMRLRAAVRDAGLGARFTPAIDGLADVLAGNSDGRGVRFLGWTTGDHWFLDAR
ncbi:MAG: hypothetical protein JWQ81_2229 [Amycolatopsis sp.]|uniref:hypothetical protein n=1 Tax=Amycolatopsis sp. TaxID=37632 RepID=UPI002619C1D6|nr:hypothetical protein [Amycolatopsis sp.]MCU1681490.1 hypothetical protein [Amycolatopsis sp.]